MNKNYGNNFLIILSLIFFLFLDLITFSQTVDQIKPTFFLLGLIYWNIALPEKINLYFAFIFGLLLDFIQGTVLGFYPLILVIINYLSQRFFYQFRPLRFIQQAIIILVIFFIIKFVLAIDLNNVDSSSFSMADKNYVLLSFIYALLNSLTWPPLFYVLRIFRRKWIKA